MIDQLMRFIGKPLRLFAYSYQRHLNQIYMGNNVFIRVPWSFKACNLIFQTGTSEGHYSFGNLP